MKHIRVALALCALPATAYAQSVVCQACDHVAPYFRGEGGFIATVAEGVDEVVFVASCGNVSITGEVGIGGGTIAQLFTWRNGLACDEDDGSLEIAGVKDGGWYWITDAANSAVGSLIRRDILDNEPTAIASAGAGVSMTMGKGAVYLKETATGRVGILPNILPEPPADPAAVCGPRANSSWPHAYDSQAASGCMLGGGRTEIRLTGPGAFGSTATITDGMVYRPAAGTVTVTADLWVDESGSYSTATDNDDSSGPSIESIQKGWAGKTASATGAGSGTNWLDATFSATVDAAVGAPSPITSGTPVAGVDITADGSGSSPTGQATLTIAPDETYCSDDANHAAVVNIRATPGTNAIHPALATGEDAGLGRSSAVSAFAQITRLRVVCPPQ